MRLRRVLAVLAACVAFGAAAQPARRVPNTQAVSVTAAAVPLNPTDRSQRTVGALTYVWGARLAASGTSRFGGLSGLEVEEGAGDALAFTAVSDDGDVFRWTGSMRSAAGGGLMQPLVGRSGSPLHGKREGDAEGLAATADGYAVSFEGEHRIWDYRASGGGDFRAFRDQPVPARPVPAVSGMNRNIGFEALAWLPGANGGALAVGAEDGRLWLCPRGAGCTQLLSEPPQFGYWLTGLDHLPGTKDLVAVYRFYNPFTGATPAIVAWIRMEGGRARIVPLARFAAPLTVGNLEGIAAVPTDTGYRLFLVSDNAFEDRTPTRLLAFDWRRGTSDNAF